MLIVRKPVRELTFGEVQELIQLHIHNQSRMTRLLEEYEGKSLGINSLPRKAEGKADNRVVHPFPYLISSTITGFMNVPPIIKCDDVEVMEVIDDVFKYNDSNKQNTSILLDMSVWGCGTEQFFLDKKGNIRFKRIDARDIIVVKSSDIEEETFLVIKHWKVDSIGEEDEEFIELYYDSKIVRYYQTKETIRSMTEEEHYFGMPPFILYQNNQSMLGDFERVLDVITAYNKAQSSTLNATEDITNALMVISGCSLSDEQLHQVKDMRVLADENNISAQMVYNEVPFNQAFLEQLREDIFSLSGVVDLTSAEVGNLSGSALRQRLVNLFYICSVKSDFLREGYLKRVELILTIHSLTHAVDVDGIIKNTSIEIKYNTLEDSTEMLNLVNGLQGIVSSETLLGFLGNKIISVESELEKLAKEEEEKASQYSFLSEVQGHTYVDEEEEEEEVEEWDTGSKEDVDKDEEETTN